MKNGRKRFPLLTYARACSTRHEARKTKSHQHQYPGSSNSHSPSPSCPSFFPSFSCSFESFRAAFVGEEVTGKGSALPQQEEERERERETGEQEKMIHDEITLHAKQTFDTKMKREEKDLERFPLFLNSISFAFNPLSLSSST